MGLFKRRFWILPLALFWAAHLPVAAAQPAQKAAPPVFGSGVTLVALPVFVTDRSGKAVRGLIAEDFEVEDGGKQVPIVAFQAIDVDAPATAESQAALPIAVQAEAPRQFVLLIDRQFSPARGLYFSRTAAAAFVRSLLAPGDLVAVATTGAGGLKMLTNLTSDHENAARAISGKGLVGIQGDDPLGLSGGLTVAGASGSFVDQELAAQDALQKDARERLNQHSIRGFLGDLLDLVHVLAPLHGRKQIVLLSGGFPDTALSDPELLRRTKDLFLKAGQADVVIHTVNLSGIEGAVDVASAGGQADSGSLSQGDALHDAVHGAFGDVSHLFVRGAGQATLIALARNTGGRAIPPRNDFGKALGEVDQISRHSYVIAFEAAEPTAKSDRPHSLKVRVRGEGLSVSHRTSYSVTAARSATNPGAIRLQAAEAISKGLSGGPLRLHLLALPYRDVEGKASVHALLQIDGTALSEAAQSATLAVQVYGYLMDGGRVLDSVALNTSLDLSKFGAAVKSSGLRVLTAFPASRSALDLRFFVRIGASGVTGSIQRNVTMPAFVEGEPLYSPPIFTLPVAGKVVVPFQPPKRPLIEIPFHLGSERFVPDASVILTPGRARDVCVFVWPARNDSTLEITGEIARPGEAPLPLRIEGAPRVLRDSDGFDRYVVTLVPPQAAGAYMLRLTFLDPATGLSAISETGVVLEN